MDPVTDVFGTQTSAAALAFGLNGVSDWSVQQPFLNVFKTARPWHAHTEGQWGAYREEDLENLGVLDSDGWMTRLPSDVVQVETFILTELPAEATYTAGLYRLSYEGEGEISVRGADTVSQTNGEIWFDYQPTGSGMVTIGITSTDPQNTGNHLRNIEVVKQDHIPAYDAGQVFNPLWLDIIGESHALRFMDWHETNDSTLSRWSDRPEEGDYTYHGGVPIEVIIDLANTTGTDAWLNIPWEADDTYIREMATYVRDNLNPDLRAHIELSNEVWNWMFTQAETASADATERFGQQLGDGWIQEYGARSAEMARILDEVYAGSEDQLVKVISTHTYWPGLEESILNAPAWQALSSANSAPYLSFDTYAITGYFGNSLGTDEKANLVLDWIAQSESQARQDASAQGLSGAAATAYIAEHRYDLATDLAVREMRDGSVSGNAEDSLQGLFELFRYHKSVADAHGLDLVMYEGGTHVVGVGAWVDNTTLTDFFTHLNYSEGMGQLYTELLAGWEAAGGTLFNTFVDVAEPSKWGSWGSLRHLEDSTPRHDAVERFMDNHPAPAHMKDGSWSSAPQNFGPPPEPQPTQDPDPDPQPDPDPRPTQPQTPTPGTTPDPIRNPPPSSDDVREYVFGNSLIAWSVGDPELSVAHWMSQFSDASDASYAAAIQTGMLTTHDDLPPNPHVVIDGVTEAWSGDRGQSFANADFNQITISPVNFVQDQSPDSPYWVDPSTSPFESALRIIEWADANAPGATINLYETWPEMEQFVSSFPPTDSELAAWQSYMLGDWHDWWVSLSEMLQDARPDLNIRLIDVGPTVMEMLADPGLGLSGLAPTDLFKDDAPHGTPTLYLLSSMVHYTALHGAMTAAAFQPPASIHPAVRENFDDIATWLTERAVSELPAPLVDNFVDGSDQSSSPGGPDDAANLEDGALADVVGTGGDDRMDAVTPGTLLDGGGGDDTVSFAGDQADYVVFFEDDTVAVRRHSDSASDAITLRNIELVDFDIPALDGGGLDLRMFDGMADLDLLEMATLTELYIAYFNRAPDAAGLYFWGDQLSGGMEIGRIAEYFFDQPETRALYGSLDDMPAFVSAVYQNVLGRDPDGEGLAYWLDLLDSDSGVTPANFIQAIIAGAKAPTGGAGDAEYLANKVMLGGNFAVTRGISDIEDARMVMQSFDGSSASLSDGITQSDAIYQDIVTGEENGFLMQLVGVPDDAFVL